MKTIREWLETIEDETIRTRAIQNALADKPRTIDNDTESLASSIIQAFIFLDTKEGLDYWSSIYEKALKGTIKTREI